MKAVILLACLVIYASSQGAIIPTNTTSGCAPGCAACNTWGVVTYNVCTVAAASFYLPGSQAGVCTACGAGATACSTASTHGACAVGYYLVSTTCTACSATLNCRTCSTGTSCLGCANGYKFTTATGVCTAQGLQWSSTQAGAAAGILVAGTNPSICPQDGNNNGICISYGTTGCTATQALSFEAAAAPTCQTLTTSLANCILYTGLGAASSCAQYAAGYQGTGAAAGVATTITNCQLTTTGAAPTCFACSTGWLPNAALSACVECTALNASCAWWPTGAATSYWNTTAWVSCPANAAGCTSGAATTVVTSCASGYYLNNAGTCVSGTAPAATANCWVSNGAYCTGCASGYFLSAPSGPSPCGANCSVCTGASACVTCMAGSNNTAGVCVASKSSMKIVASGVAFFSMVLYYFL